MASSVSRLRSNSEMSAPETNARSPAPREDDHADLRVGLEGGDDPRHRRPHVERHRVVLLRLVEDHPADAALLAGDHLRRAEIHVLILRLARIFPLPALPRERV